MKALKVSILISIIGYFYNLGIINYSAFGNNELRLYDIGMLLPLVVFLFSLVRSHSYNFDINEKQFGYFVLYCAISFILFTTFFNIFNFSFIRFAQTLLYFYHLAGFFIISIFAVRIFDIKFLINFIYILISISAITLLLQHLGLVDHIWPSVYTDSYGINNFSGFLGPNRITPAMMMFFSLVFLILVRNRIKNNYMLGITLIMCCLNILMIGSRTTYIASIIFILFVIVRNQSRIKSIVYISIVMIAAFFYEPVYERVDYIFYNRIEKKIASYEYDTLDTRFDRITARRLLTNKDYLRKISNEPWVVFFGRGFNNRYIGGALSAHNQYLSLLFEVGIIGLLLFVKWLYLLYITNINNINRMIYKGFIFSIAISLLAGEHLYVYRPLFALLGFFLLIINIITHDDKNKISL